MLARNHRSLLSGFVPCLAGLGVSLAALGGCTVKEVDTDNDVETSANSGAVTSTSVTTGGGDGGAGGATAGTGTGGAGGEGGAGGAATGTGGGEPACFGETGTGKTAASCDEMNITPAPNGPASSSCGEGLNEPPPGYGACIHGFSIYTAGSAENFQACLSEIGVEPANACDIDLVAECVGKVYEEACENAYANEVCDTIAEVCGADTFNAGTCKADLVPFSKAGVDTLVECVNAQPQEVSCQDAYNTCFDEVRSF